MEFKDPVGAHQTAGIPITKRIYQDVTLEYQDFSSMTFMECSFINVTINKSNLTQTMFMECKFEGCRIINTIIMQARWIQCICTDVTITGGFLAEIMISACEFEHLKIEQNGDMVALARTKIAQLSLEGDGLNQKQLTISECEIDQLQAENSKWIYATAVEIDFSNWSIDGSHFELCSFIKSKGEKIDFSKVRFEKCNLYQSEFSGAKFRNADTTIFAEAKLPGLDCEGADMHGCMFVKADVTGARFDGANLTGAMFPEAVLTGASLVRIHAPNSVWHETDLTQADLDSANLNRASLRGAVFDKTNVEHADMRDTDLHGVKSPLLNADTAGSRGTLEWRAEVEEEVAKGPPEQPAA